MAVSRWGRLAAGGVAVAVVAAGLTVGAGAAGASTGRKVTVYRASKSGYVTGPSHLRPGRIKIRVHGTKGQSFQLVRSRHGAGKAQLLADAGLINSQDPNPNPIEHDFVLAGGTNVGEALYVTLKRGTYYAVDIADESPTAAKIKQITVSGKKKNAAKPHTHTITAIKQEDWAKKPKSIPHKGVLRFVNHAKQPHFIVLSRLKKGKTRKDIGLVFQGKEKDTDVFYQAEKDNFDTGVISPKGAMSTTYKLPKGHYALMCFWPDAKTHMPHAIMGMYRVIKLK